jgi:integrase
MEARLEYLECERLLHPYGKTVRDAVDFYLAHLGEQKALDGLSMHDGIADYLAAKEAELARGELSPHTVSGLKSHLKRFQEAFGGMGVRTVSRGDVTNFLNALPHSYAARTTSRTRLSQFFNYAIDREWRTDNPVTHVEVKERSGEKKGEVGILTPDQVKRLLATARKPEHQVLVPYYAVGLYAGLRPFEAAALRWEDFHWQTGEIEIRREITKVRQRRFVPILDVLTQQLAPSWQVAGPICPRSLRRRDGACRRAAGFQVGDEVEKDEATGEDLPEGEPWPQDVMRHSFASYWIALHQDRAKLAEILGNSQKIIGQHYRRAIPRGQAETFFLCLSRWGCRPCCRSRACLCSTIIRQACRIGFVKASTGG